MKKLLGLAVASIAIFVLSGCAGDGNGGEYQVDTNLVSLYDLYDGYCIQGHQSNGHDVDLSFDNNSDYIYLRYDDGKFNGRFDITNGGYSISFYDDDGGSYRIDTDDRYLHKGYKYSIVGIDRDIIIDDILRGKCNI